VKKYFWVKWNLLNSGRDTWMTLYTQDFIVQTLLISMGT